jgi:hypothetical protein
VIKYALAIDAPPDEYRLANVLSISNFLAGIRINFVKLV